jgi:sugar phosphate isomerase/epimerase
MLLAYSTWGMPTVPIEIAVANCAALGFDGLELTVIPGWTTDAALLDGAARRRIRALYDDYQLALCGLSGNVPLLDSDGVPSAEAIDRFRTYLDLAADLQHPGERLIVTTTSGGLSAQWDSTKAQLVEHLGVLCSHAERAGVRIGIEPHVDAALHLPDQALWLLAQVNSPALTIHFDISHFNVQGLDMDTVIAQLAPHSAHSHVKDERGIAPNHAFLIPGEGEMDYVRYLTALDAIGYVGYIVVEISLMVQRRPDYDPLAAAATSYEVLSRAFQHAGIKRISLRG